MGEESFGGTMHDWNLHDLNAEVMNDQANGTRKEDPENMKLGEIDKKAIKEKESNLEEQGWEKVNESVFIYLVNYIKGVPGLTVAEGGIRESKKHDDNFPIVDRYLPFLAEILGLECRESRLKNGQYCFEVRLRARAEKFRREFETGYLQPRAKGYLEEVCITYTALTNEPPRR